MRQMGGEWGWVDGNVLAVLGEIGANLVRRLSFRPNMVHMDTWFEPPQGQDGGWARGSRDHHIGSSDCLLRGVHRLQRSAPNSWRHFLDKRLQTGSVPSKDPNVGERPHSARSLEMRPRLLWSVVWGLTFGLGLGLG